MMLAKFAFITRAKRARVGPLVTRSMIPIRNFRLLLISPSPQPVCPPVFSPVSVGARGCFRSYYDSTRPAGFKHAAGSCVSIIIQIARQAFGEPEWLGSMEGGTLDETSDFLLSLPGHTFRLLALTPPTYVVAWYECNLPQR